jgi:O-antigen ligase/tetratricopeptide (TPR) repeat protein
VCEAAWLLVLACTPILFDARSMRPFEALKEGLLRTVAVLIVLALVFSLRRGAFMHVRSQLRGGVAVVVGLAILLCATELLSTAASIDPMMSLFGTWHRQDGLLHSLACLTIGGAVVVFLRTRAALERVITAVLLGSSLVALYALTQHHDADPLRWFWSSSNTRPASTVGNPIQMSAYLVLALPLGIRQVVQELRGAPRVRIVIVMAITVVAMASWLVSLPAGAVVTLVGLAVFRIALPLTTPAWLRVASGACVVALGGAAFLAAQSRGPAAGLGAGLVVAAAAWCAARARRRWALAISLSIALLVLLGGAVNLPRSPLARAKALPVIGRTLQLGVDGNKTVQARVRVWRSAIEASVAHPERAITGSGSATFMFAFNEVVPPELGLLERPGVMPDRAHNEVIQRLVTTGVPGAAAYVALQAAVIALALAAAGALRSRRRRWCVGAGAVIGALCGGGGGSISAGAAGALVAAPVGAVAGLVVGLLIAAFDDVAEPAGPDPFALALVAAFVGHAVELQAGFGSPEIDALWWILIGVLLAWMMRPALRTTDAGAATTKRAVPAVLAIAAALTVSTALLEPPRNLPAPWLVATMLATLVLVALGHGAAGPAWAPGTAPEAPRRGPALVDRTRADRFRTDQGSAIAATGAVVSVGVLLWAAALAALDNPREGDARSLILLALSAAITAIVVGVLLAAPAGRPLRSLACIGAMVGLTAMAVAVPLRGFAVLKANRLAFAGVGSLREKEAEKGLELLRAAAALVPRESAMQWLLGAELLAQARRLAPGFEREQLLTEALAVDERARDLSPLDPTLWAELGRLHSVHAQWLVNGPQAVAALAKARRELAHASSLRPRFAPFLIDEAIAAALAGDFTSAARFAESAAELDARTRAFTVLSQILSAQGDLDGAIEAYRKALRNGAEDARPMGLSALYQKAGRIDEAIAFLTEHLVSNRADGDARARLVELLRDAGRFGEAERVGANDAVVTAP